MCCDFLSIGNATLACFVERVGLKRQLRVLCYEKINAIYNDSGYFIDILSSYVNKRNMRKSYMSELIEIYPMYL